MMVRILSFLALFSFVGMPSLALENQSFFLNQNPDIGSYFEGLEGCVLIYDLEMDDVLIEYNRKQCKKKEFVGGTFSLPVRLMASDSKKIAPNLPTGEIIAELGEKRIQKYLADFGYSDQALLDENIERGYYIKVSPETQLDFLKKLWARKFAISEKSQLDVIESLHVHPLDKDTKLKGLSSVMGDVDKMRQYHPYRQIGWYVGYLNIGDRSYAVVVSFKDKEMSDDHVPMTDERAQKFMIHLIDRILLRVQNVS